MSTTISPFANDYKEPVQVSNYLRLNEGVYLLRILTAKEDVVSYFVEFVDQPDGTKVKTVTPDAGDGSILPHGVKRHWGFLVWNWELGQVQVWEVSQKKIQTFLADIAKGKIKNDWRQFDIQITRKGKGMNDTEYTIITGDSAELPEDVKTAIEATEVDLKLLAEGKDPFPKKD